MQASLSSLRAEYEASQASLFDLTTAQEAAAGSASTAEQLATEVSIKGLVTQSTDAQHVPRTRYACYLRLASANLTACPWLETDGCAGGVRGPRAHYVLHLGLDEDAAQVLMQLFGVDQLPAY
jgi:hypothetical protein